MPLPNRTVRKVRIDSLDLTACARQSVDEGAVADYARGMKSGTALPPVLVYDAGECLLLVDGLHRVIATRTNGHVTILAEVRTGSRCDAIWEGCAANKRHGLRRTNLDKRRAVELALLHPRGRRLSNRQLAGHCGVHHHTVGRIRSRLELSGALRHVDKRLAVRGGVGYLMATGGVADANRARVGSDGRNRPPSALLTALEQRLEGLLLELEDVATLECAEPIEEHGELDACASTLRSLQRRAARLQRTVTALLKRHEDVPHSPSDGSGSWRLEPGRALRARLASADDPAVIPIETDAETDSLLGRHGLDGGRIHRRHAEPRGDHQTAADPLQRRSKHPARSERLGATGEY